MSVEQRRGYVMMSGMLIGALVMSGSVSRMAMAEDAATSEPAAVSAEPAVTELAVPAPAAQPPAPPSPPALEKSKEEQQREAIRAKLNGTTWELDLKSDAGKTKHDTITFDGRQVTSAWLSKAGYGSSNYSVTVNEDEAVWETMQSNPKEGLAFWRGELPSDPSKMYGALSKQPKEGQPENYSFVAAKSGTVSPTQASTAAPSAAVAPPAPATTEPAASAGESPKSKKKKRGLF